jgi:uncharacterized protein (TIGR03437 family)
MSPGWVRFPSGAFSSAYDWTTGLFNPAWVAEMQGTNFFTILNEGLPWLAGKGGAHLVDAVNRANFFGAKMIVSINAYTDTPQSAGQFAAFAKANHIPVAIWELANEPYVVPKFFTDATDYLNKVKPYRDAIKAADPSAVVAIYFDDAGSTNPNPTWDQDVSNYQDKYWDAVTIHHYPPTSQGDITQWMADENGVLASKTSSYMTNHVAALSPPGMKLVISEFDPTTEGNTGVSLGLTAGTMYGGVYCAEYVMRMSTVPNLLYVGMHAIDDQHGIFAVNTHYTDVAQAGQSGGSINTLQFTNFGFYPSAQILGLSVLNNALRAAVQVNPTTVTGGATVNATGVGQIPALYAQAYTDNTGKQILVITNKGSVAQTVTVNLNGSPVSSQMPIQFIGASDPSTANTSQNTTAVKVSSTTSSNPITVPPYSVVRADLNAPSIGNVVNSASYQNGVAPDELATLFGSNMADGLIVTPGLPLQTMLGNTSIHITDSTGVDQATDLVYVAPSQASFIIPSTIASGAAKVTVFRGGSAVLTANVTVSNSLPGLYSQNGDGAGVAAANSQVGSNVTPTVSSCDASTPRSCLSSPLSLSGASGDLYLILYGTGIRHAKSVTVYIGGQQVTPAYAGAQPRFPGLDQINVVVPRSMTPAGETLLYVVADGVYSNVVSVQLR